MFTRFYFKIDKKAGLCHDEDGNDTELYSSLKLASPDKELSEEDNKRLIECAKKIVAHFSDIDTDLVEVISKEEYLKETEEEGEE